MPIDKLLGFLKKKDSSGLGSAQKGPLGQSGGAPPSGGGLNMGSPVSAARSKAMAKLLLIIGGAAGIVLILLTLTQKKVEVQQVAKKDVGMNLIKEDEISSQNWMAKSGEMLSRQQQEQSSLRKELEEVRKELSEAKKTGGVRPSAPGQPSQAPWQEQSQGGTGKGFSFSQEGRKYPPLPPPPPPGQGAVASAQNQVAQSFMPPQQQQSVQVRPGSVSAAPPVTGSPGQSGVAPALPPPLPPPPGQMQAVPPGGASTPTGLSPAPGMAVSGSLGTASGSVRKPKPQIGIIEVASAQAALAAASKTDQEEKKDSRTKDSLKYIPSGSWVRAVLMTGMDAPTGSKSRSQPHPILLRIQDPAIMPNEFKYDFSGCFVIGEGYGELAAERAYIRTTSVSCIRKDGKAYVDSSIKGYVVGEDGKTGLRGEVVSKNGTLIARALIAGFVQGVADAFNQSSYTTYTSGVVGTTTQTINPSEIARAGVYGGVGKSMEMLAKYYTDLSQEVFPIIEVEAGRKVNIVLTSGYSMKFTEVKEIK